MATRERPADRGSVIGRRAIATLAREFQNARRDRGLSLRTVASAAGVSPATVWRFERTLSPRVSVVFVARLLAIVGLDLSARAYPGPTVLRDQAHAEIAGRFRHILHASIRWKSEVAFPNFGDQRRWDGVIATRDWRYGVEVETGPQDGQALAGRTMQKLRDGGVDGVILVLPSTRRVRGFLDAAGAILDPLFPIPGALGLQRLREGRSPGGSSIIVLGPPRRFHAVSQRAAEGPTEAAPRPT